MDRNRIATAALLCGVVACRADGASDSGDAAVGDAGVDDAAVRDAAVRDAAVRDAAADMVDAGGDVFDAGADVSDAGDSSRAIYITLRADAPPERVADDFLETDLFGSGTAGDPFDGSGRRFAKTLYALCHDERYFGRRIILGEGMYESRFVLAPDGWPELAGAWWPLQLPPNGELVGAGIDRTTIRMTFAWGEPPVLYAGSPHLPSEHTLISDLTVDANFEGNVDEHGVPRPNKALGIESRANDARITRVRAIGFGAVQAGQETFVLIWYALEDGRCSAQIDHAIVEGSVGGEGYGTAISVNTHTSAHQETCRAEMSDNVVRNAPNLIAFGAYGRGIIMERNMASAVNMLFNSDGTSGSIGPLVTTIAIRDNVAYDVAQGVAMGNMCNFEWTDSVIERNTITINESLLTETYAAYGYHWRNTGIDLKGGCRGNVIRNNIVRYVPGADPVAHELYGIRVFDPARCTTCTPTFNAPNTIAGNDVAAGLRVEL